METPQYEPITILGKLRDYGGFHFLDPLGGLGMSDSQYSPEK